jgi:hydrogenase maturation protease
MRTCCVIGVGCSDHGDQVAGPLVARRVARSAPANFLGVESSGAPAELIGAWRGIDRAVIVEAMPGDVPGAVQRCRLHPRGAGCSSAMLSPRVREALALGPLPPEVIAITITAQCFARGAMVTPAVAAAAEQVAALILADVPPAEVPPAEAWTPTQVGVGVA